MPILPAMGIIYDFHRLAHRLPSGTPPWGARLRVVHQRRVPASHLAVSRETSMRAARLTTFPTVESSGEFPSTIFRMTPHAYCLRACVCPHLCWLRRSAMSHRHTSAALPHRRQHKHSVPHEAFQLAGEEFPHHYYRR